MYLFRKQPNLFLSDLHSVHLFCRDKGPEYFSQRSIECQSTADLGSSSSSFFCPAMLGLLSALISCLAAAVLLLTPVFGGSLQWQDCDCGSALKITDVRISDCDVMPCIFYKGKNYDIEFDAYSTNISSITLPYSVSSWFVFPVTLAQGDACQELSRGSCPLQVNAPFTFRKTFEMEFPLPTTTAGYSAIITAKMKSDYGIDLICARLHIIIRSSQSQGLDPGNRSPFSSFFSYFRSGRLYEEQTPYFDQGRMLYF